MENKVDSYSLTRLQSINEKIDSFIVSEFKLNFAFHLFRVIVVLA